MTSEQETVQACEATSPKHGRAECYMPTYEHPTDTLEAAQRLANSIAHHNRSRTDMALPVTSLRHAKRPRTAPSLLGAARTCWAYLASLCMLIDVHTIQSNPHAEAGAAMKDNYDVLMRKLDFFAPLSPEEIQDRTWALQNLTSFSLLHIEKGVVSTSSSGIRVSSFGSSARWPFSQGNSAEGSLVEGHARRRTLV